MQGSSAGAGSGEFHVYKAARRREQERLRVMDEEVRVEEEQREFEVKRSEREEEDRAKTERNRLKREKMKARKDKAKAGKKGGDKQADGAGNGASAGGGVKARVVGASNNDGDTGEGALGKRDVDTMGDDDGTAPTATVDAPGLLIHDDD